MEINNHLKNPNHKGISSALEECLNKRVFHLGKLIGQVAEHKNAKKSDNFYSLFSKLLENTLEENKNTLTKPRTIKLLCNWLSSKELAHLWNKMSQGDFKWNNLTLVWDKEPDYYVVINKPPDNEFPEPKKTIIFRMEPHMDARPDIWGDWANPDEKKFVKVCKHSKEYNNNEWHLSKTYEELLDFHPEKKRELDTVLSTVLSEKYRDPGHIKRIDFVKYLDHKGLPVHVYGSNKWDYEHYKGPLPYHKKDDGLFPYKYTFNVENFSMSKYYTEKVIDGILSECLVFYNGCFNLKEFLPEDSFVYLELVDFEHDYQTVKKAIEEDWWSKRLPAIRKAKRKILNELQFFPRLERIIFKHESQ